MKRSMCLYYSKLLVNCQYPPSLTIPPSTLVNMKRAYGFTIVELLIVIVVIAILAVISIVAYNGVSSSANDATVKSDLANMAKKIQMIHAQDGEYPAGGAERLTESATGTGNNSTFPEFAFPVSRGAYHTGNASLHYCRGYVDGSSVFRLAARSKSGQAFEYTSTDGLVELGSVNLWNWTSQRLVCQGFGYPISYNDGYGAGVWRTWTAG